MSTLSKQSPSSHSSISPISFAEEAHFEPTRSGSNSATNTALTPIRNALEVRFEPPGRITYSTIDSVLSIASLILMSAVAGWIYQDLAHMPTWVRLPFLFTIIGATLGWVFELGLLSVGRPFELGYNSLSVFVQKLRFLNLAPVATTIFFFVCAMVIPDPGLRLALLYLAAAACFGLGAALFFGGATAVPLILLGTQVAQALIVVAAPTPVAGSIVAIFLIAQAAMQLTALLIGTGTPIKSAGFHVLSTVSGVMLYLAVLRTYSADPESLRLAAPILPAGSLLLWGLVVTCLAGLVFAMKASPLTYSNFRASLSNGVWSSLYFQIVSLSRFPDPVNLSAVYDKSEPEETKLKPYYQAHPENLTESLSIPAVEIENIEKNVKVFAKLWDKTRKGFKVLEAVDKMLPQANLDIPLKDKPRLTIWSDGSEYWPGIFKKKIFGATIPGNGLMEPTPEPVLAAFKEGQLLAYLTEFGVGNTFVRLAPERGKGALVSDFRYQEKYMTKPDYESYGGVAYFQVNSDTQRLELVSVVAPHSSREILANPADPAFCHAQRLVLASLYFAVIAGKHLCEIHMTYNLVEVSMHNAFDVQKQWKHPFRTFMYLHFFSHELAEEITTEHLVQEGAVFSQVFATTHDALIQHLNDGYSSFEYGTDEDFDARVAAMTMSDGNTLPRACINWELEYFALFQRYTTDLIEIIYANDEAVCNDRYLQDFHSGLLQVMLKGLPARYDDFKTRSGVARFAAETIHHTVIRHQVYGTTGIRAALDPRISSTQVPRDTGTPGVDEWRSLACVALATGEARFTLLTDKNGKDFTYLLKGVEECYAKPMARVFEQLQTDLQALDTRWTSSEKERRYNYAQFRPLPSALHTGPGY